MRRTYIYLVFMLCYSVCYGQTVSVNIQGKYNEANLTASMVYLSKYYGNSPLVIDSTVVASNGNFWVKMQSKYPKGMYTFSIVSPNQKMIQIDFIYSNQNINILAVLDKNNEINVIVKNKDDIENKLFYEYIALFIQYSSKERSLYAMQEGYNEKEEFHTVLSNQIEVNKTELKESILDLIKPYPRSFMAEMILWQTNQLTNLFMLSNTSDSSIIFSTVIPSKLKEILNDYTDENRNYKAQELIYKNLTDSLFFKFKKKQNELNYNTQRIYEFLIEQWLFLFKQSPYPSVYSYTAENYFLTQSCNTFDNTKLDIKTNLEKIKRLAIGQKAPNIIMENKNLYAIKASNILVIFWSAWCPHCEKILSELKDIYEIQNTKELEIVAISIDKDEEEWENSIVQNNYYWINYCDLNGWHGKAVKDYNVQGTPTMFLLDKSKTIVARPVTITHLKDIISP